MSTPALRREEGIGLAAAVVLHAGLFAVLLLHPGAKPPPVPERMTVTIADVVAEQDTSPTPNAEAAAAAAAPEIGEPAPPPAPVVTPPRPEPAKLAPPPPPAPKPVPQPKIAPKPEPKPLPKVEPRPAPPKPAPVTKPRPDPIAEALAAARRTPVKAPPAKTEASGKSQAAEKPAKKPGGSRIGNDFLAGVGAAAAGKSPTPPAAAIGPEVKAGLASSIARQLKPRWVAPQGADAEQLVTVLAFDLNEDGTLTGTPRVVRQEGITDSNRAQAPRHAEQAIRAVRLAAPFDLPPQYYAAWKRVAAFRFDRKLSQ